MTTILADTLSAIARTSEKRGLGAVDLSLLTDGLQAEREQGITIDVAYRYMGTWYEIAKYPNYFQRKCVGNTTADYALQPDKTVQVTNRCEIGKGEAIVATAEGRQVGGAASPRLEVRFAPAWLSFLPFVWADYWVIDLDEQYQLAAVSEPKREYLWILSRTPQVEPQAYAALLARLMRARVLSLAVFEPVAFHLLSEDDAARIEIENVVADIHSAAGAQHAARTFIDYWNRAGAFDALPEAQQQRFAAQIAKVKLDFQALLGEAATLADMAALDMPALVLSGERSPQSTRRVAACLAAALPNGAAVQTRGGHMAPITHAAEVNPLLAAFLAGAEITSA
eukprot:gene35962-44344_t